MKCVLPLLLAVIPPYSYARYLEGSSPLYLQHLEHQVTSGCASAVPFPLAAPCVPFVPEPTPAYMKAARTVHLRSTATDPRLHDEQAREAHPGIPQKVDVPAGMPIVDATAHQVSGAATPPEPAIGLYVGAALLFLAGVRRPLSKSKRSAL